MTAGGVAQRDGVTDGEERVESAGEGTRARITFCVLDSQGHEPMILAAQPVLERLAGGMQS